MYHFILLNWVTPSRLFELFLSLNLSMDVYRDCCASDCPLMPATEWNSDPAWQQRCTTTGLCTCYGSSDTPDLQQYF